MPPQKTESYLQATRQKIDQQLGFLVPENSGPAKELYSAARYSLLGGGKRLRPIIVLATTQTLQGDVEAALNPACALEMVHAYSLIHDDLPSMDNDDFRRGKPTLHKVYPESHAILAGDFLLNFAFEVLCESPSLSSEQKLELIKTLSKSGGGEGMIGGQVMDLEQSGKVHSLEALQQIHQLKTSALMETAFAFGAIIAKAPQEVIETLKSFGRSIGLIFQIIDDVLDVTASQEKHGHEIGSDKKNKKTTYASILGVEKTLQLAEELHHSALSLLSKLPYNTCLLEELAETMMKRKK